MSRSARKRFGAWIVKSGGTPLEPANQYEFARFKGGDGLCIIYRNKSGVLSSFQGELCRAAHDAWRAGKPFDLRPTPSIHPRNTWRDRGEAVASICEVRTGTLPAIAVDAFARDNNLDVDVLVGLGLQHGLTLEGDRLVRPTQETTA